MVQTLLVDTHCHLDQYPDPRAVIQALDASNIVVVAVTTTPSAFQHLRQRFAGERRLRFALGIHPLHAGVLPDSEWQLFHHYLEETSYIGEVGLDFSPEGIGSRDIQEKTFRQVLQAVAGRGKLLSIHSRRAEAATLDLLVEYYPGPAIFHWYSGPLGVLNSVLKAGHYCSINPAMVRSKNGQRIIEQIPTTRILLETDGPYVSVGSRPVLPTDIELVCKYLSGVWKEEVPVVLEQIAHNFRTLLNVTTQSSAAKNR